MKAWWRRWKSWMRGIGLGILAATCPYGLIWGFLAAFVVVVVWNLGDFWVEQAQIEAETNRRKRERLEALLRSAK